MFSILTLSLAIGAPVPAPTAPIPAGVAPKVMELKPSADGKIMIVVARTENVRVGGGAGINPPAPGGAAVPAIARVVSLNKSVELGEVKDLTITTADGKKLTTEEAIKKIAAGAIVVVSGDGKPVSPTFLKVFKDDTLILASPELIAPQGAIGGGFRPGGGVRPVPINPGGIQILPGQPGVIQIQVGPAAVPAAPPAPAQPAPAEKPPVQK